MTRNSRGITDALRRERQAKIAALVAELMHETLPDGVHMLSEASLDTLERAHVRDQILEARHIKRGS